MGARTRGVAMPIADPDVRSRYLALALDARKIIDTLMPFADEGKRAEGFEATIDDAIKSLKGASAGANVFSPLRSSVSFSEHYEQVRAVDEALGPEDREKIVQKLANIQEKAADIQRQDNQREDAFEAIELLAAIESQALYNHRPYDI